MERRSRGGGGMREFIIYVTVTKKWVVEADTKEQAIDDMEYDRDNAYMHKVIDREVMVEA